MLTRLFFYFLTGTLLGGATPAALGQAAKRPASPPKPYQAVDARMRQVPDSCTRSVAGLARYINASFTTDSDKARAAFGWVARNIRYDVENQYFIEFQRPVEIVVQETLNKRMGVCRHYAELYNALANQVGLPTYVVRGYGSLRTPVGHAWCASRLDGRWYLMEPTWAADKVVNGVAVARLDNDFFKVAPAQFIESHMPFDPLWQLLPAPRTPDQYQWGKPGSPLARPFAFADSLAEYGRQTPVQRLRATARRVEQNGVKSDLIYSYLVGLSREEENLRVEQHNQNVLLLNTVAATFNQGNDKLNQFVEYFNRQFLPKKPDDELRLLLPPIAADLIRTRALLATVNLPDSTHRRSVAEIQQLLGQAETRLRNSQEFMDHYLRTGRLLRPMLFMNISTLDGRNEMMR
ncbi:transglutaminase domain-containing protein [Hymenobacter amundsenii]|nr:transglutaminase domain-containing protein [Hymenobacter amundsenii]